MSHFTSESGPGKHDLFAFEDQPPPLDTDFNFHQKPKTEGVVGDFHKFDDTFDVKPTTMQSSQKDADLLGDFLSHERQQPPVPRPKDSPPAIPTFEAFDVQAEINTNTDYLHDVAKVDKKEEEDFGQIQPDYLNPYATVGKLESNEKFISTDDLIGLSDNEGKADKENAFEDCNKDDEEEEVVVHPSPPVAKVEQTSKHETIPEPVKETPKPAATAPPVVEPPKPKALPPQKNPEKPVELLEAEKIFIRCGLGKSCIIIFLSNNFISIFITHQCCARSQSTCIQFFSDVLLCSALCMNLVFLQNC